MRDFPRKRDAAPTRAPKPATGPNRTQDRLKLWGSIGNSAAELSPSRRKTNDKYKHIRSSGYGRNAGASKQQQASEQRAQHCQQRAPPRSEPQHQLQHLAPGLGAPLPRFLAESAKGLLHRTAWGDESGAGAAQGGGDDEIARWVREARAQAAAQQELVPALSQRGSRQHQAEAGRLAGAPTLDLSDVRNGGARGIHFFSYSPDIQ